MFISKLAAIAGLGIRSVVSDRVSSALGRSLGFGSHGSNARIRWAKSLWGVRRQEHAARVEHVAYVCDLSCRTYPAVGRAGGPDSRTIEFSREFPLSARPRHSSSRRGRAAIHPKAKSKT